MTKFNSQNKAMLSYGEALGPAMKITDKSDAEQYLKLYVEYILALDDKCIEEAIDIAKSNLGYYAGYYDNETRERVERLFSCQHPIFGSMNQNGAPTALEAFALGQKIGQKHKI